MNTTRMVIILLISTFFLPFLRFVKFQATGNLPLQDGVKYFREMVREGNENKSIHMDA